MFVTSFNIITENRYKYKGKVIYLSGDKMKKGTGKKIRLRELILPNKKLNYFAGMIILLGVL